MPLHGVPLVLLGLVGAGVVALLISFPYTKQRAMRKLLSSGIILLLVTALVIVTDALPRLLGIGTEHVAAMVLLQIANVLWWLTLAHLAIRVTDLLLWRGLLGGQEVPKLLKDVIGAAYYIAALFAVVGFVFEQPVTGLLATSGVVAVVLGFALQNTLSDVFSGIALNMEHPYRQGDWIRLDNGFEGEVVEVNWRATHLRSRQESEIIQPNSGMATARTVNFHYPNKNYAFNIQVRLDFRVPPARAKATLKAAALACERVRRQPAPVARILSFEDSFVLYDMKIWTQDYAKHPDNVDEVLTRVWEHLRWAGISFAFPQRNVHLYEKEERDEEKSLAVSELLEEIDLFASLQDGEKESLAGRMEKRHLRPGQKIVEQGEEGQSLYVVAEGLLEVRVRFREDGPEQKVAQLGPGDFFGEMSLLTGAPRSASVIALTEGVVYNIEKVHFEPILQARPFIAETLAALLGRRQEATRAIAESQSVAGPAGEAAKLGYAEQVLSRIRGFFQLR
jgi:small-conductance mechanosensitive channel/CRP-like cAMP-binding protein